MLLIISQINSITIFFINNDCDIILKNGNRPKL